MSFDPNSTARLKALNQQLAGFLANQNNILSNEATQRQFLAALKNHEAEASAVIGNLSTELDAPNDEVGFADFLSDIGNSVVETQRKLDEQSRVYLEQTKGNPHVAPAIYRLPKVSASIKFGMKQSLKKGFNIVVAQRTQEDERMLNQSLEFEIISVPPPPDYRPDASIPEVGFLYSPVSRSAIFEAISNYQPRPEDQKDLAKSKLLDKREQVLVLHLRPQREQGKDDYLLLLADDDHANKENVGVWYLQVDPIDLTTATLEIILKFSATGRKGEQYALLRNIVMGYSQNQAPFL